MIVGEGYCDVAFVKYLKGLYLDRNCGVSVKVINAHGKGPENVLQTVLGRSRNAAFDTRAALLDTDLIWTPELHRRARRERTELIGPRPCLEGLLLDILAHSVPSASNDCKHRLRKLFHGDPTLPESYAWLFPRQLLEDRRPAIETLDKLLRLFRGRGDG